MKEVLKLPAYRRLLAAYTLNELATQIGAVALALLVYRRTGSEIAAAAYFLCAMFGPALLSPSVVARLDQRSSRSVLVTLYALEAIVFAVIAWVAGRFSLAAILALALLDGVIAVTARALARAATVAVTSSAGLLREANAVTNVSFSVAYMVGPALGGLAVVIGGVVSALVINSGIFALMALVLATAVGMPGSASKRAPVAGRLRAAVRYARDEPGVRRWLDFQGAAMLFGTIPIPVEVVLAEHTLHRGAFGYGALLSGWGAGAVLGSAVYVRWRTMSQGVLAGIGASCMGVGIVIMGLAPSLAVATGGAAVGGVGNGIVFVASRTALQEAVQERWMALMMSLSESIIQGAPGAGIVLGGTLAALAGPRPALVVGGVGAVATGAIAWLIFRPGGRGGRPRWTSPADTDEAASVAPLTEAGRIQQSQRGRAYH